MRNGPKCHNINGDIMKLLVNIRDAVITGVEKGSADKNVERPVCAFSFQDDDGNKVKALLKGSMAKIAYEHYLKGCNSEAASVEFDDGTTLDKEVTVSFDAYV